MTDAAGVGNACFYRGFMVCLYVIATIACAWYVFGSNAAHASAIDLTEDHGATAATQDIVKKWSQTAKPVPLPSSGANFSPSPRPNFILVLADDLEADYKQDRLSIMPNLASGIASKGVHLVNHVTVQSTCGPSRAALLSGRFPHNLGYFNNDEPGMCHLLGSREESAYAVCSSVVPSCVLACLTHYFYDPCWCSLTCCVACRAEH